MRWRDRCVVTGLVLALSAPMLIVLWLVWSTDPPATSGLLALPLVGKFVGKAVKGIGKAIGGAAKGIGGLVSKIPIVGSAIGDPLSSLGRSLAGEQGFFKGVLPAAATLFAPGLGGALGGLGGLASKIPVIGKALGGLGGLGGLKLPSLGGLPGKIVGGLGDALKFAQGLGGGGQAGGGRGGIQGLLSTLLKGGGAVLTGIEGTKARGKQREALEAYSSLGKGAAGQLRERLAAGPGLIPDPMTRRLKRRASAVPPPTSLLSGGG